MIEYLRRPVPEAPWPAAYPERRSIKLHDATKPTYLLQLDAGAFMAVWEHMEAEAKHRFPTHGTYAFTRAYLRAVQAFRDCYWANHEAPDAPKAPVRKLVRKARQAG